MLVNKQITKSISLKNYGINNAIVHYQLSPEELHQITINKGQGEETSSGALAVNTGEFTGRSPKDRFLVKDEETASRVWWGDVNIPFDAEKFDALYNKVVEYLSDKEIYVRDCYACADVNYQLNIRSINEYPWSNLFSYNMFLRPEKSDLKNFKEDWVIINPPLA